jgi:hypothetical protein
MGLQIAGNQGQTGKQTGQNLVVGMGETTDVLVTELRSAYYQETYRGNKYTASVGGAGQTLVAVNLFSTAIATFQPIIALYNPITNTKNFSLISAYVGLTAAPNTPAITGGFFFVGNSGQVITNSQITNPSFNNLTFKQTGSTGVVVLNAVLAGAVGNPILIRPLSSNSVIATTAAASSLIGAIVREDINGAFIITPGSYIAIANGVSNTTSIVVAGLTWDEISI